MKLCLPINLITNSTGCFTFSSRKHIIWFNCFYRMLIQVCIKSIILPGCIVLSAERDVDLLVVIVVAEVIVTVVIIGPPVQTNRRRLAVFVDGKCIAKVDQCHCRH